MMERVLLTQSMLDEMVQRIVPKEYWPLDLLGLKPPDLSRPAVVTNITAQVEDEFLSRVIKYWDVDELLASMPRAYTLNWGVLRKNARLPDWEDYRHSSSIWINETALATMGTLGLEFILLHEVGHADWAARIDELATHWRSDHSEIYADHYAHQRLTEVYDDQLATLILRRFCSRNGVGKENTDYDA